MPSTRFNELKDSGHPIAMFLHGVTTYFKYGEFVEGLYYIYLSSLRGIPVAKYLYAILGGVHGHFHMKQSIQYIRNLKNQEGAHWGRRLQELRNEADYIIGVIVQRWPKQKCDVFIETVDRQLLRRTCGMCVHCIITTPRLNNWSESYYEIDDPRLCDECVVDDELRCFLVMLHRFQ